MYPYSFVQWLLFFYLYCFIGWIWESCYVSLKKRHLVNRGFLHGPLLPIYGFGAMTILLVTMRVRDSIPLIFLAGMAGATILEYFTGAAMERIFHVRYWDYSNQPLNLNGHICLISSLAWGFFSILLVRVVHKPAEVLILAIPGEGALALACVLTALFAADTVQSVREALDLKEVLKKLTLNNQELHRIQKRMDVITAFLADDSQRLLEKLGQSRKELTAKLQEEGLFAGAEKSYAEKTAAMKAELERLRGELEKLLAARNTKAKDKVVRRAKWILKRNPGSISEKYKKALEEIKANLERRRE